MTAPAPKTLEEHIGFHFDRARLMLWFAWTHVRRHPEEGLETTLRERTQLWRIAALPAKPAGPATEADYATPACRARIEPLLALHAATSGDADARRFEEGGFAIFRDALEAKARATFATCVVKPHGAMGALSYDPPTNETPTRVGFHIDNPLQPRSIFDDPDYLRGCLLALMADAEARHGATELTTGTWLNSYPPFLRYFPPEYTVRNMSPDQREVRWGDGTWGQFVNARGCLNRKHAALFRQTGVPPFPRRTSWCTFETLRQHLAAFKPGAPA